MAKKGGFPGGMPGNMGNLMKQAQKMQKQMEEAQEQMQTAEFSATSGGGAVEATVSGTRDLTKLTIDPEVIDPEDKEMLEDLIISAVNAAMKKADEVSQQKMSQITGGLGGLF